MNNTDELAEMSVIGSILLNDVVFLQVMDKLKPEDFLNDYAKQIYQTAIDEYLKGELTIDYVTLLDKFKGDKELMQYGLTCAQSVPIASNGILYADVVLRKSLRRKIMQGTLDVQTMVSEEAEIPDICDKLYTISELGNDTGKIQVIQVGEVARGVISQAEVQRHSAEPQRGITTGFKQLDRVTRFDNGNLYIVGGRPGMGKTAVALKMALIDAQAGKKVIFFSLEMPKEQLMLRLLAMKTLIDHRKIKESTYDDSDYSALQSAEQYFKSIPLYIEDKTGISLSQIKSIALRQKADIIYIDYLDYIKDPKAENKRISTGIKTRNLKAIAKELKIPVICLCQLNRGTEGRKDNRPMMSDLKESGDIEQDADAIIFVYREGYYRESADQTNAELITAKNRHGATGTVNVKWHANTISYYDIDRRKD